MALSDINFQESEGQDFILELPAGTLNSPDDILAEADGGLLLMEEPAKGDIFIMSE